jgi:hypothetical protein
MHACINAGRWDPLLHAPDDHKAEYSLGRLLQTFKELVLSLKLRGSKLSMHEMLSVNVASCKYVYESNSPVSNTVTSYPCGILIDLILLLGIPVAAILGAS